MAAKTINVSADGITFYTLPGDTGDLSVEAGQLENTIFGQDFASSQAGLITWNISSNARWRGFAGYCATIKKSGTSTAFTGEAFTFVSGKTWEITNRAKSAWDWTVVPTISDGGGPIAASNIQLIDYVHGRVTFISTFTPTGSVTGAGSYLPLTAFARAKSFNLTQSADTTDTTDFETACANGGFATMEPTLLTADLELSGFYRAENELFSLLTGRETFIVEIDPEGNELSVARGIYKPLTDSQTGDVGGNEEETFSLGLFVPEDVLPFSWRHASNTTLPNGVRVLQDAWLNKTVVYVQYLAEGEGEEGREGQAIVTDLSMASAVDDQVVFTVALTGTGQLIGNTPS